LYEGFGYPPLEAMKYGIPVAVSNSSSLPEIVGEAGLKFDPYSPEDIAKKIINILFNNKLSNSLIEEGYKRVKKFNEKRFINSLFKVYKELYKV